MPQRSYFVHLDLLRVFFVFVVLIHHWVAENPFTFLPFGSTIAFVLSGFLLTGPLLKNKKQGFDYWRSTLHFLARRLLRTLPIYLLLLCGYCIININNFRDYAIYFFTFSQNYLIAFNMPKLKIGFGQTWSLAIQEQFYVFLPIIIYFFPYKYLRNLFIVFSVAGLLFRLWYFHIGLSFTYNHFTTECCIDCLGIGALISYYHYEHPDKLKQFLSNKVLLGILILSYIFSTFGYSKNGATIFNNELDSFNNLYRITERTFVSLLSVWFIGWGIYFPSRILNKISSSFVINYLSKISYGIYIYHFAVASIIKRALGFIFNSDPEGFIFIWWVICLNFVFTIIISIFSFELFEKPILTLKEKNFGDSHEKKSTIQIDEFALQK